MSKFEERCKVEMTVINWKFRYRICLGKGPNCEEVGGAGAQRFWQRISQLILLANRSH